EPGGASSTPRTCSRCGSTASTAIGRTIGPRSPPTLPVPQIVTDQTYHETSPLNCTALVRTPSPTFRLTPTTSYGTVPNGRAFTEIGDAHASTVEDDSPHPLMHRTESVDYGVVISGEMTLVLDKSETALREGDVVIQRGTNHAWANRSGKPCRMLFILVDGRFEPGIPGSKGDP